MTDTITDDGRNEQNKVRILRNLSPSHLNEFYERRPLWLAKYILGYRFPVVPIPARGIAVEHAITSICRGADIDKSIGDAMEEYDKLTEDCDFEQAAKVADDIPRLVDKGMSVVNDLIKSHGHITQVQERLEGKMIPDGMTWIGYTDIRFESELRADIKVSGKQKQNFPHGWGRQGTFYHEMTGHNVLFISLIPLKTKVKYSLDYLPQEYVPMWRQQLIDGEKAIKKALSIQDTDAMIALCMPDASHYTYENVEPIFKDIWGKIL